MLELEREIDAIKFVFGIGGHENELVENFRSWKKADEAGIRGYLIELQTKENILLQKQLATSQNLTGKFISQSHSFLLIIYNAILFHISLLFLRYNVILSRCFLFVLRV